MSNLIFLEASLKGVFEVISTSFSDSRGHFFENFNDKDFCAVGMNVKFLQDNVSFSHRGVIRGLHAQSGEYAQAKFVSVLQGHILDVAIDIREGSPTFGQHVSVELSDKNNKSLFIPRGFLHGFKVLSENAIVYYKCDNYYQKDAEIGVRYDDPLLNIQWGRVEENISDKDKSWPGFKDVISYRG
jgi:dTDP-4-dehydrorhamnose 3,5-epimerase